MNLILVDAEYTSLFKNENNLRTLLGNPECKIYLFNYSELKANNFNFDYLFDGIQFNRCVYITGFNSGFKNYHYEILKNTRNVVQWTFSVLDIRFDGIKSQLILEINSKLAKTEVRYNVVFDDSRTLHKTAKELTKKVNPNNVCIVVSKNQALSAKASKIVSEIVPEWDIVISDGTDVDIYDEMKIAVVVGENPEDFDLQAPSSGMGKYHFYINSDLAARDKEEIDELKNNVADKLLDNGWRIRISKDISCGNLRYEQYNLDFLKENVDGQALLSDSRFVIWDNYSLPITPGNCSEKVIRGFFNRICSLIRLFDRN